MRQQAKTTPRSLRSSSAASFYTDTETHWSNPEPGSIPESLVEIQAWTDLYALISPVLSQFALVFTGKLRVLYPRKYTCCKYIQGSRDLSIKLRSTGNKQRDLYAGLTTSTDTTLQKLPSANNRFSKQQYSDKQHYFLYWRVTTEYSSFTNFPLLRCSVLAAAAGVLPASAAAHPGRK